jgi:asparagine synthase (glutamine-hydrolysing)
MCGIAGQLRLDGAPASEALVEAMCAALEHRGPDARGLHADGPAVLGIQRLRVIDLESGDQPVFNEDRSVAVVLNGEIYNYRELRARLADAGHRFSTDGDSEVIAHLYEEQGPACVRSLHGMFAFALWDARARRLLLARDRVGKKPLLYSLREGALSFASELNALMQDAEIPRELDREALDAYLALRYVPAPRSAFRAVRKLPPASTLVLERGRARIERYWQLDYATKHALRDGPELREQIRAAVRRRLVADVPLGAFLSGGIDSSAVVAAMAETSSRPVRTFSIGFASARFNELPKARLVAELFGTEHEELVVEPDAVTILPQVARQYGEPFADASAIPSFYLAEMASRHVTVALNGDGGDESFGGYGRYVSNALLQRAALVPAPLRAGAARLTARLAPGAHRDGARARLRRAAAGAALPGPARYASYLAQTWGIDRTRLCTPEWRAALDGADPLAPLAATWERSSASTAVDAMLDVDVQGYLADDLLPKMDIASMAHSLEARSPLLDHQLMEFAAALPAKLKVRGLSKKVALRACLRGWVPDVVLDAPKQGFELPVGEWLRSSLRDHAYEVLLDPGTIARGIFRPEEVRGLLDRHDARREDNTQAIWSLLVLELWQRECVDRLSAPVAAG